MDSYEIINDIFEIVQDPRNVSPGDMAYIYHHGGLFNSPIGGEPLSEVELAAHFEKIHKFQIPETWTGYKPLKAKVIQLLMVLENQNPNRLEDFSVFYINIAKKATFRAHYLISDDLQPINNQQAFIAAYSSFIANLKQLLIKELKQNQRLFIDIGERPNWFVSDNAYRFFLELINEFKSKSTFPEHVNHSFIFHSMKNENLLVFARSSKDYLEWLYESNLISEHGYNNCLSQNNGMLSEKNSYRIDLNDLYFKLYESYFP